MWIKQDNGFVPIVEWTGNWLNVYVTGLGCCLFGFPNENRYISFMIQNAIFISSTQRNRMYRERSAKNMGFSNYKEYHRQYFHDNEMYQPMSENKDCSLHFGVLKGESLAKEILLIIFEYTNIEVHRNRGFDITCKNPRQDFIGKYPQFELEIDNEYIINSKTICIKNGQYVFHVDYNKYTDYFIFLGYNRREDISTIRMADT